MEVTRLSEQAGNRVDVEVDGEPWRTLPAAVVARAGLLPGVSLDRPRLRAVARELRRSEALTAAARVLRAGDLSSRSLDARLERRGIAADARADALDAAARAGLLDDERYALRRAEALAGRGRGNAAIRWQLERDGVSEELVERALAALEPERDRAARVVARRGEGPRTARHLAARGFDRDSIEAVLGVDGDSAVGYEGRIPN